ncbi:MAG: molybdopterin-dependent oxidoreductase [Paracoccus sp. (in: a-proteobacteria)]|uniref:molybdopterin-dependent oxidoreductase n=1 Tax=Paracoccus sp. TaxID=267 RepID=UPI0026DF2CF3|nr:molybdopterin-dependent oxidoreductase [Paracoccus sp. (in: a-proteobacteria)]MDO5620292.1 molybdopterin-dependent oxidoreductase [Paracoccus sp. (in: a-proteobacteria)]
MSFHQPTRRGFIFGGLALTGTSALLGTSALANMDPNTFRQGRVFSASHYGPFEAVVKDGRMVAVNPLAELDGRPTEMLTHGIIDRTYDEKTRINYPMVRKSYLEGWQTGDTKPELRGKEPFVRVDWDTAYKLAAKAIVDTISEHGNEAVFSSSYGGWSHSGTMRPNVLQGRLFNLLGGCTITVGDWSGGASEIALPHIIGDMEVFSPQTAWEVIRDNTEVFVLLGCDPIKNNRIENRVADHGMSAPWEMIRDAGVQFLSINPQKTASDAYLNAEWLKIIPNTDVPLFLGMAYHVLENGWQDDAYLAKYTTGSDRWIAYVKGEDDGTPKTPEWAAAICGIDAAKIRELAELFATRKTQFAGAWSLQRAQHGEMTHWVIINFAALLGKIGKPGEGVGFSWHFGGGGMPQSGHRVPRGLAQGKNFTKTVCPASRITEMLENPGMAFSYNGNPNTYPDVKMIYNAGNNFMSHQQDVNRLIKALEKVDTIVCQDVWWCAATQWADIIMAANSPVERDDLSSGGFYSNDRVYAMKKIIDPVAESKSDYDIFAELGAYLGVEQQFTDGLEYMDHLRAAYDRTSAAETVPFEEFWEKGYVRLPMPEKARSWVRHGAFYENPEENPLHTESGKIEMFCESIARMGHDDCPGMPIWMEPHEYLGNAKEGQLHVVSPHPWYRLHSQMANSESLRNMYMVQGREPVLINRQDAEARGITDGDIVELYNDRGTVIAGAILSDEIMPGVMSIYEGGWPDVDSKGRCNGGQVNFITSTVRASGLSEATSANTCLAWLRKCEDPERPNRAFEGPQIITDLEIPEIDEASLGLERMQDLVAALYADMQPGERLFYEACTVCHGPRDPGAFTQLQWRGILPSMIPNAGLEDADAALVTEFLMQHASDAPKP